MSAPSALEQYMLELVNRERAKVGVQPLAFDHDLNEAAGRHSRWMIKTDTFSHEGAGKSQPHDRMVTAGYVFTGAWASGENIAWASTRNPSGYADEVRLLHGNLMNSAPHKANILNGAFREIGIGFDVGSYKSYTGAFATQNFARTGTTPFITGVAFDDKDGDRLYDPGEGLRGLQVKAVGLTGGIFTTATTKSGGYDLPVPSGTYTVTVSGPGIVAVVKVVTVGASNVKVDVMDPTQVALVARASAADDAAPDALRTRSGRDGGDDGHGPKEADTGSDWFDFGRLAQVRRSGEEDGFGRGADRAPSDGHQNRDALFAALEQALAGGRAEAHENSSARLASAWGVDDLIV